jgi:adenylate cyclase
MAPNPKKKDISTRLYVAFGALISVIIVGLIGGILWYNFDRTRTLTIISAERLLAENADKTITRIQLFYDPVVAIVSLASRVPQISEAGSGPQRPAIMMTGLRRFPQIFSLYVGLDDGAFEMMMRVNRTEREAARRMIGAPENAVFAQERVLAGGDGIRRASWSFFDESGTLIESHPALETSFDPRDRQWYQLAQDDAVHRSEPYLFAGSKEIGFTLSRKLAGPRAGVFGADLSLHEASDFLARQKVTKSSIVFIFNERGEVAAYPDETRIRKDIQDTKTWTISPTTIADLNEPALTELFRQYKMEHEDVVWTMEAGGESYLARVTPFTGQFGNGEFLGIVVPVAEITHDIEDIRLETLAGSFIILLFTLPLLLIVVFVMIDVRVGRKPFSLRDFMKFDPRRADDR